MLSDVTHTHTEHIHISTNMPPPEHTHIGTYMSHMTHMHIYQADTHTIDAYMLVCTCTGKSMRTHTHQACTHTEHAHT